MEKQKILIVDDSEMNRALLLGQHRTENCVQKMSLRGKIKT